MDNPSSNNRNSGVKPRKRYQSDEIYKKLYAYYSEYYRDLLHLKNWNERIVDNRYYEEDTFGKKAVQMALDNGVDITSDSKVLVVGCGTGAELFHLYMFHTKDVYGIEPFEPGIEICRMKAAETGLPQSHILKARAEQLPFEEETFDAIICFTVIEHVDNVEQSFREIYRVLKKGAQAFLLYPDYRYPEEQHFKIKTFPPALMPALTRLHLKIKGKYSDFFETLNFITPPVTRTILDMLEIDYSIKTTTVGHSVPALTRTYCRLLGISRNQLVLIKKH